tara:strand:- start:35911 stop:36543 length:633 start_codon:yes stop_codon:yes gene_type:complete
MVLLRIFKPIIESQFNNKSTGLGFIFFLLPFILIIAVWALFGFVVDFGGVGIAIVRELLYWIFATVLIYLLLMAFKGKEVKGKFSSIMAAFPVIYLVNFLAALSAVIVVFITIPGFFEKIASLQGLNPSFEELVSVISSLALPSQEIMLVIWLVLGLIGVFTFLINFSVFYRIGNLVKKTSIFSNLIFVIVFMGISYLLNVLLSMLFGLF